MIRFPGAAKTPLVGSLGRYSAPAATSLTGALLDLSCASPAVGTPVN